MAPRSPDQNERLREQSRQALLDAAFELFADKGFERTSMRELANRAGVSKGLAYHYFPSKEALLDALVSRRIQGVRDLIEALPDDRDPQERLRRLLQALVEDARVHAAAHRLQLSVFLHPDVRSVQGLSDRFWADRIALAETLVQLVEAAGSAEPRTDAHLVKLLVTGLILEHALSPSPPPAGPAVERLLSALKLHPGDRHD